MDTVVVFLFLFLFGSVATGKDITFIHISTPPRVVHVVINHPPRADLPIHNGHEQ